MYGTNHSVGHGPCQFTGLDVDTIDSTIAVPESSNSVYSQATEDSPGSLSSPDTASGHETLGSNLLAYSRAISPPIATGLVTLGSTSQGTPEIDEDVVLETSSTTSTSLPVAHSDSAVKTQASEVSNPLPMLVRLTASGPHASRSPRDTAREAQSVSQAISTPELTPDTSQSDSANLENLTRSVPELEGRREAIGSKEQWDEVWQEIISQYTYEEFRDWKMNPTRAEFLLRRNKKISQQQRLKQWCNKAVVLGEGSYGRVYPWGNNLVLKVLITDERTLAEKYPDAEQRYYKIRRRNGWFRAEAQQMQTFDCPNIVRCRELMYSWDGLSMGMLLDRYHCSMWQWMQVGSTECVDEDDELQRRNLRIFSPSQVFQFLRDISGALAYLHDRGLIHSDVKLENVLICNVTPDLPPRQAGLRFYLTDLGLVQRSGQGLINHVGTKRFWAPEIFTEKAAVDAAADIWALGVTALEAGGLLGLSNCSDAQSRVIIILREWDNCALEYFWDWRDMVLRCWLCRPTAATILERVEFLQEMFPGDRRIRNQEIRKLCSGKPWLGANIEGKHWIIFQRWAIEWL